MSRSSTTRFHSSSPVKEKERERERGDFAGPFRRKRKIEGEGETGPRRKRKRTGAFVRPLRTKRESLLSSRERDSRRTQGMKTLLSAVILWRPFVGPGREDASVREVREETPPDVCRKRQIRWSCNFQRHDGICTA